MAQITHGDVVVTLPDDLPIPERAGAMSPIEVARTPKAPRGLGAACDDAAAAIVKAGAMFVAPLGVTPDSLRKTGHDAEFIDGVIASVEFVLNKLKQANILLDAEAWERLRKVNDVVVAQGKTNPEVLAHFAPLRAFMTRGRPSRRPAAGAGAPADA